MVSKADVTIKEEDEGRAARRIVAGRIQAWYSERNEQTHSLGRLPLRRITQLDLKTAGLRVLPSAQVLGALSYLRVLRLGNNKLRQLCGGLLQCLCLEELYLDDNYLVSIQGELRSLHCLRVFSAKRNLIGNVEVRSILTHLLTLSSGQFCLFMASLTPTV